MSDDLAAHLAARLRASLDALAGLEGMLDDVTAIARRVVECLRAGGTVYTCGNGGSAAEALHLAEEIIGRYAADRAPQRAVCLNADPTALTCIANDYGYDRVFARQCEALLREGDVLVALTTSGKSANILEALKVARATGATTIGLLGKDGGPAKALCDLAVIPAGADSAPIQEAHIVVVHLICEAVDRAFT